MFYGERSWVDFVNSSNVGLAIFDDQLRYQALNRCLAAMHGIPVEVHLGRTIREMFGEVALQVEPALKEVLSTGVPILNLEITGAMPTRAEKRRWIDNFFPLKDEKGKVKQIGVVVVELRPDPKVESSAANRDPDSSAEISSELLRSWKEIANYIGTCVKTAQRWEERYSFPVRRIERSKGATVFALKTEVDRWIRVNALMAS